MPLKRYLQERARLVDAELRRRLPSAKTRPATIHEAMRYSVFAGGKRLRPILCLAACEACGGEIGKALPLAAAVEVLHTYTLIHDDLPCMDDDDFRRGMPTCHKRFGEGIAVLAGDALLTLAFEIVAEAPPSKRFTVADYVRELAVTGGSRQLIGGQVLDLEGEGRGHDITPRELRFIHESKTAALLATSVRLGAMAANATPDKLESVTTFGHSLGLAFQIIDDILDVTQTSEQLGKSAGKDVAAGKSTYPALFGLEKSRAEAARLTRRAREALTVFGKNGRRLEEMAGYLLDRDY
ncbi:MAG: polyprenyl synthetase family protein [Verrucomicrobiae bacterium]|nr:polyprenyl synthetase family protein [Verrucomicrobiae bacterium]MCP5538883.1 polyprenyl synthetase family protein [Akkermansiaceae bacterium]MCP5551958.1 polyprenyl synthetase family protein [Akkermansiaceae bacterium]